jgi:hypothetical protein
MGSYYSTNDSPAIAENTTNTMAALTAPAPATDSVKVDVTGSESVTAATTPTSTDTTPRKRILITPEAKAALTARLLKTEIDNKNEINNNSSAIERSNIILAETIKALQEQNQQLLLENRMLSGSVEKYKSLYHGAQKQIFIKN